MTEDADTHLAGDYRLIRQLSENEVSRLWLAEQVTVGRQVLVEELRPECRGRRDGFLANARAKAAVKHPLIASVYEAVADEAHCFFARERLHPHTLEGLLKSGETLEPAKLARVLRLLADAQLHHEAAAQPTDPPGPAHLHVDEHEVVRIDNLALAGTRDPAQSAADIARFGHALRPLVADARPGTTRMLTLLSWMRGEGIDARLDWRQVADICSQIEQQLSQPPPAATPTATMEKSPRGISKRAAAALAMLGLLVVLGMAWHLRPQRDAVPLPAIQQPDALGIPAGPYPSPDGGVHHLPAYRIAALPVGIGQYAEFLDVLETLSQTGSERSFDHREQPADKSSHLPDAWPQQLKNPHHLPVVGVDWWDAAAFAEWKKARLPSQDEWFAAWHQAATANPAPFTSTIREWTCAPAIDPANPLGGAKWVIITRPPGARQWIDDRSLRSDDLGFRIVFTTP